MPEQRTRKQAAKKKTASGKAGEYVREEMDHIREGKHGARNTKQAIAIGLSKARRDGVKLPPPPGRKKAPKATNRKPSPTRSRAVHRALEHEGKTAASPKALSEHAKSSARQRGPAARQSAARKAVRTKGTAGRKAAAQKAARTRAGHA
ncbi:MAG: DUF6496 domain-containing protein [Ignavibacteriota bacterium]